MSHPKTNTSPPVDDQSVEFIYQNHQGEIAWRHVIPLTMWYGSTQWHPEPQWLLKARDLDRDAERDFAV